MNSVLNRCFLNYEIYFICSIEEVESCQKHRLNEVKIAASRDTVK